MVHQVYRLDPSQLDSPRIHRFHDCWQARRAGERIIPLRQDLDPTDLRELLPNIVIIDVERERVRFRYRLVCTRVAGFNKLDFTGLYLGAVGWQEEQQLVDAYTDGVTGKGPLFGSYAWTLRNGNIGSSEFGLFPFSHDGSIVTQIFGIEDYDFPRGNSGAQSRAPT